MLVPNTPFPSPPLSGFPIVAIAALNGRNGVRAMERKGHFPRGAATARSTKKTTNYKTSNKYKNTKT